MSAEDQIKAKIQAAIAKKKQQKPIPAKETKPVEEVVDTTTAADLNALPILRNDVDWIRTFFGRPIRIAVHEKKVYYAVPDVMGIVCSPEELAQLTDYDNPATQKVLAPLVSRFRFASPNGGQDKLYAAEAEAMIAILHKLELNPNAALNKWLTDTSTALMMVIG